MRPAFAAVLFLLIAGCIDLAQGQLEHRNQERQPDPGIRLHTEFARNQADGDVFDLKAWAENKSGKTYGVNDVCGEPWRLDVTRQGQNITYRAPIVTCAALGKSPYRPGNNLSYQYTWDGREWDPAEERLREAGPGTYEVTIAFWFYPDDKTEDDDAWCCTREIRETFSVRKT